MHRRPFLRLLEAYRLRHPEEVGVIREFQTFVEKHEDCFERTCIPGHLTGSAFLVNPAGDSLLLTHHRKLDCWLQLGGHADGEPEMLEVALKEAQEESGLPASDIKPIEDAIFDLDIHPIPARGNDPLHLHHDVRFLLQYRGNGNYVVSDESHDLAWAPLTELDRYTTEESIVRMAEKWANSPLQ
jgi:8-oxo-dGTP pyrophosphatase MutT (NUDIX family)